MPEPDVDELTELLEPSPQRRLPFAFARRHGVFLLERDGVVSLCLREGAALTRCRKRSGWSVRAWRGSGWRRTLSSRRSARPISTIRRRRC